MRACMRILALCAMVVGVAGCGGKPTCVAYDCLHGVGDEQCLESTAYCDQNIADRLNACSWKEVSGSCASNGFDYQCHDNLWTHSSSDCSY